MAEPRMYPGTGSDERTTFAPYSAFDLPADLRELHGRYDVEAVARRVRNFRYAEEWTMMILGGWVATVPELPVKTGLGRIIWETAQAADKLGKRLPELRCGTRSVSASEAPNEAFAAFVRSVAEPESPTLTIEKLSGVFDVLLPHLADTWELTAARPTPSRTPRPSRSWRSPSWTRGATSPGVARSSTRSARVRPRPDGAAGRAARRSRPSFARVEGSSESWRRAKRPCRHTRTEGMKRFISHEELARDSRFKRAGARGRLLESLPDDVDGVVALMEQVAPRLRERVEGTELEKVYDDLGPGYPFLTQSARSTPRTPTSRCSSRCACTAFSSASYRPSKGLAAPSGTSRTRPGSSA